MKRRMFLQNFIIFIFAFIFGYTVKKDDENMVLQKVESNNVNNRKEMLNEVSDRGISLSRFGAVGDGKVDDSDAIEAALNYVKNINGKLVSDPQKTYLVKRLINIDTTGVKHLHWNMMGSTIDFGSGGSIILGSKSSTPFKTTTLASDLKRKKTNFTVRDVTGVKKGDLVSIQSPVNWVKGIPLIQYYTIGDIDGNTIYVNGLIVGDISEEQKVSASVKGDIIVSFFKLAKRLTVKNGTLKSSNRDDEGTLLSIRGQDGYLIEDIEVQHSKRNGIYIQYSGSGLVKDCRLKDHGYVTKDQGYVNTLFSPNSLSFGYGIIVAHNYLTHIINCHSFSGWHGFDVARGQTVVIYQDCVIHKDAFGFSAHEGAWDMRVIDCQVLGGLGVTSRAAELTVSGCHFKTSIGPAITGNGSHHTLLIKHNVFDVSTPDNRANVFYLNEPFPEYCYSQDMSVSDVSQNTIIGLCNTSRLFVRGLIIFADNTITSLPINDGSIIIKSIVSSDKVAIINNNRFIGTGMQHNLQLSNFDKITVSHNHREGPIGLVYKSAVIALDGINPDIVITDNNFSNIAFAIHVLGGSSTINLIQGNKVINGQLLLASTKTSIKNAIGNITNQSTIVSGQVNIRQNLNNVVISM
ncbi:hypothetical protein SRABI96_00381 [Peribacillus sp. Bi96]|uniref:right-handed parallel beta-helix repeat-containing protein n=1 Tax=Peribacillus sp. Bi96 TaxID=2884273 RepID=UPI001D9B64AA|nr:right-handed parallel beta-helix repeat-containing protein [Peribacillus sp. Bi96]CAH0136947.1 hypothetical protein SRABI96_00381 [Peribacillus sp. Bi96]